MNILSVVDSILSLELPATRNTLANSWTASARSGWRVAPCRKGI